MSRLSLGRAIRYYRLKTFRAVKRQGVLSTYKRICRKVRILLFQTTESIWMCKSLDEGEGSGISREEFQIEFSEAQESGLIPWLMEHHGTYPWMYFPEEIETARSQQHYFVNICQQGYTIGYVKIGRGSVYIHDFDQIVSFPPDVAVVYDTFVLPSHRRRGIASYVLTQTTDYLRTQGFEKIWCHIESWNQSSLKTFKKVGFKAVARIRFSRICGVPFFLKDGRKPFRELEEFINQPTYWNPSEAHG